MKWLKWLLGDNSDAVKRELREIADAVADKVEESVEDVVDDLAARAKLVADATEKVAGGYIDEETGKVYKTESALKGVRTRRRNKAAKKKVAAAKKTQKDAAKKTKK